LCGTVIKVSLAIIEDGSGKFVIDRTKVRIADDLEEIQMSNEEAIRQDIEDMGCVQYLESELFIISQYSTYSYLVQVESRTYMEQKMPFAGAGLPGDPPSAGKTNFGTDIFQLGFILWLLAEHRWNPLGYYSTKCMH
jgi:hypothetical protein